MEYLITFLEGIISFISPCMLPMLPVYISYFAGNSSKKHHVTIRAFAFVLGFTVVFTLLGIFAGTIGSFLIKYRKILNIICGAIVIILGLSYLDVIRIPFFKGMSSAMEISSVFSAFLFGMIYSVSLTPCIGAFLGSALMLASTTGGMLKGGVLLLVYSLGLGIPFVLSAVLLDRLKGAFKFIKQNYRIINRICGVFLIVVGLSMCFGFFTALMTLFS